MLNRRKKQIMDPKRINNYNKFLSTFIIASNIIILKFLLYIEIKLYILDKFKKKGSF
jgi:uncharacterized membrane protein